MGVPDMVLVDMEVTVLVLPAMEVTDLDTVSGRDPLMPIPKLGEPSDTDTFRIRSWWIWGLRSWIRIRWICLRKVISISPTTCYLLYSYLVIILTETKRYSIPQKQNQILFRHVSSKVEEEFLKWQTKEYLKISYIKMCYISTFYTL